MEEKNNDIKSTNQNAEFDCMYIVQCIVLNFESESLTSQFLLTKLDLASFVILVFRLDFTLKGTVKEK